jgi:hypothetical protein
VWWWFYGAGLVCGLVLGVTCAGGGVVYMVGGYRVMVKGLLKDNHGAFC